MWDERCLSRSSSFPQRKSDSSRTKTLPVDYTQPQHTLHVNQPPWDRSLYFQFLMNEFIVCYLYEGQNHMWSFQIIWLEHICTLPYCKHWRYRRMSLIFSSDSQPQPVLLKRWGLSQWSPIYGLCVFLMDYNFFFLESRWGRNISRLRPIDNPITDAVEASHTRDRRFSSDKDIYVRTADGRGSPTDTVFTFK